MRYVKTFVAGLTLAGAAIAVADNPAGPMTRPTDPQNGAAAVNQVRSPFWNGGQQAQQSTSDLPATEIRAVPVAHAQAVQARWTFNQALVDLSNATRILQMQLDMRPEYVKAINDEKTAYDAMEAARKNALSPLADNAAYNGAEQLHTNLVELIADEKDQDTPDPERLAAMAKLKLDYVKDNRKLEASALERDQAYQDARQRYIAAGQHTLDLRHDQMLAIATDDNLQSIRKQVADARVTKLATDAFYESAIRARNIAVDYALLYRGVDIYHGTGNAYGYGGYGYGGYGY